MLPIKCISLRRADRMRKGLATVELAICLPVLVIVVLGSIEATDAIFLKQRLTAAAYEGARSATTQGKTSAMATTAANNIITQFGISGSSVTITPTVTITTPAGTQITVIVNAPLSSNMCIGPFIIGKTITNMTAQVVMVHQ
ncbi:MAG: TadE family protein [Thermoguttaceae bacterium]